MRNIADVRVACAALPGSQETFPFDATTLVFKVAGKMYALTDVTGDPVTLSLKCDPVRAEALRAEYDTVQPGYHLNKRHWNTLTLDGTLPDALVRELLQHSYDLVVKGLPRALRDELLQGS